MSEQTTDGPMVSAARGIGDGPEPALSSPRPVSTTRVATWTQEQDDRSAFEEAMDVADISVRRIEARLQKLRLKIATAGRTNSPKALRSHVDACLAMVDGIESLLQRPAVSQWRQQHSEGRGRRHAQQHVLEVKLALARELLTAHGVDFDMELANRRLGS